MSEAAFRSFYGSPPPLKIVHKGKLMSPEGHVSPLCAKTPRKINLAKENWTVVDRCVTCKQCLAMGKLSRAGSKIEKETVTK